MRPLPGTSSLCLHRLSRATSLITCQLPNADPKSGVRDAAVPYKVLMQFRTGVDRANMSKPCFGCNGVPEGDGTIQVGDTATIMQLLESEIVVEAQ